MKKISIREFQLHANDNLNELPLTLTKHGKDIAIIESVNGYADKSSSSVEKKIDTLTNLVLKVVDYVEEVKLKRKTISSPTITPTAKDSYTATGHNPSSEEVFLTGKCTLPICRQSGHKYKYYTYEDEGLVSKEGFLCSIHLASARNAASEYGRSVEQIT